MIASGTKAQRVGSSGVWGKRAVSRKEPASKTGPMQRGQSSGAEIRGHPAARSIGSMGGGVTPSSSHWTRVETDAGSEAEAIDPAELKEFLEADWTHIQADPQFKERLRGELWRMVEFLYGQKKDGNSSVD